MDEKFERLLRAFVIVFQLVISNVASIIAGIFWDQKQTVRRDPEKRSEWLDSLRGEFGATSLLTDSELKFIADLRNHIIQEANSRPSFSGGKHLENKLSVLKDKFKYVVKYLRQCSKSRDYFMETYPRWKSFRQMSILQLRNIAKALNIDKQESAAAITVGSGVSIIGGLVCLVTGAGALGLAGRLLLGLGSLATAATSWSETELLKKKMKEAETIIREDKMYSEKLWNWISDMSYHQRALESVSSIEKGSHFKKIAVDLFSSFKKKSTEEEQKMFMTESVRSLIVSPEVADEIADVIGILIAICMLQRRFRPLFNRAFEAYKCYKVLSTACIMVGTAAKVASAVNAGAGCELTSFQACRIYTGIALDVINLIRAAESLNSASEEAEGITRAADNLEVEARVFYGLYEAVRG